MIFRSSGDADLPGVLELIAPDPASTLTAGTFKARFDNREYRPEWTWVAEETTAGPTLAVGVWWGSPGDSLPSALDGLFVREAPGPAADRSRIAAALLAAAHAGYASAGVTVTPDFHLFLPGDWRDRPDVAASLAWRPHKPARTWRSTGTRCSPPSNVPVTAASPAVWCCPRTEPEPRAAVPASA